MNAIKAKTMKQIIVKIYELTPKFILKQLSGKNRLRKLKDFLLKQNNEYKTITVKVQKTYHRTKVDFNFTAPIKIAVKAKNKGIESTILKHSLTLLEKTNKNKKLVVYDVGANYGFLSLVWGKIFKDKGGKVYSFEPSPTVSKITEKNILDNSLKNVRLIKKAVGNTNGYIKLFDGITTSNVLEINDSTAVDVEITSLDSFTTKNTIQQIDLIKIDVDGIEYEILKGSEQLIKQFMPILIVETNSNNQIIEFIEQFDYIILNMRLEKIDYNSKLPSNIFCVKSQAYNKLVQYQA